MGTQIRTYSIHLYVHILLDPPATQSLWASQYTKLPTLPIKKIFNVMAL
jgi:hypothetical protein